MSSIGPPQSRAHERSLARVPPAAPNGLASAGCRGPAAGAFGLTTRLLEREVVFSFFFIYLVFLFLFVPSTVRPLQAGRFFFGAGGCLPIRHGVSGFTANLSLSPPVAFTVAQVHFALARLRPTQAHATPSHRAGYPDNKTPHFACARTTAFAKKGLGRDPWECSLFCFPQ